MSPDMMLAPISFISPSNANQTRLCKKKRDKPYRTLKTSQNHFPILIPDLSCIISYIPFKPISSFLKERAMMSQQQRLIYLPLFGTIILCLLVGAYLAASKRFTKSTPSNKVTKHKVKTPPDEALKYWTSDRMRNARAAPLPGINNLGHEKQDLRPSRPQEE